MLDDDRRPAEAWARDRLAGRGVEVVGEVAWPHVRAWSALATLPTDGGTVWLKTVPEDLRHEAALTALVHRRRPDAVPEERSLGRWHDALRLAAASRGGDLSTESRPHGVQDAPPARGVARARSRGSPSAAA